MATRSRSKAAVESEDQATEQPAEQTEQPDQPDTGTADASVAVDRSSYAQEQQVVVKLPYAQRGQLATRFLEAAEELGYPREAVQAQSDGFKIPRDLHQHLYPSEYADEKE